MAKDRSIPYALLDNIIGFDDGYESLGERAGAALRDDPMGVARTVGAALYDSARDFGGRFVRDPAGAVVDTANELGLGYVEAGQRLAGGIGAYTDQGMSVEEARDAQLMDALTVSELLGGGVLANQLRKGIMPSVDVGDSGPADPSRREFLKKSAATAGVAAVAPDAVREVMDVLPTAARRAVGANPLGAAVGQIAKLRKQADEMSEVAAGRGELPFGNRDEYRRATFAKYDEIADTRSAALDALDADTLANASDSDLDTFVREFYDYNLSGYDSVNSSDFEHPAYDALVMEMQKRGLHKQTDRQGLDKYPYARAMVEDYGIKTRKDGEFPRPADIDAETANKRILDAFSHAAQLRDAKLNMVGGGGPKNPSDINEKFSVEEQLSRGLTGTPMSYEEYVKRVHGLDTVDYVNTPMEAELDQEYDDYLRSISGNADPNATGIIERFENRTFRDSLPVTRVADYDNAVRDVKVAMERLEGIQNMLKDPDVNPFDVIDEKMAAIDEAVPLLANNRGGVSLTNPRTEAMITPSMENPGKFRISYIDRKSGEPMGDTENFETMEAAIRDAMGQGYLTLGRFEPQNFNDGGPAVSDESFNEMRASLEDAIENMSDEEFESAYGQSKVAARKVLDSLIVQRYHGASYEDGVPSAYRLERDAQLALESEMGEEPPEAAMSSTTGMVGVDADGNLVEYGVGSLNKTAANMFRGPRGVESLSRFAEGGSVIASKQASADDLANLAVKIREDYGFDPVSLALEIGVDPELALRLVFQESKGKQSAGSEKGAKGLTQLMPGTAEEMGVDINDARDNFIGGMKYLKKMTDQFGLELGLAAYNAGPGNVAKYDGVPPFKETQDYLRIILEPFQGASVQPLLETGAENYLMSQPVAAVGDYSPRPRLRPTDLDFFPQPVDPMPRPKLRPDGLEPVVDEVEEALIRRARPSMVEKYGLPGDMPAGIGSLNRVAKNMYS